MVHGSAFRNLAAGEVRVTVPSTSTHAVDLDLSFFSAHVGSGSAGALAIISSFLLESACIVPLAYRLDFFN